MAMDEPTLKDLCLICHSNPPKYRCPRCSLRTCSLVCSKRHKVRAQCSGVRDPAAYVKKSELATPAAIDRDYNFLVGVERHLDRAEQDILERGLPALESEARDKGRQRWKKAENNLANAIETAGVTVEKAPAGLQRHRENMTRWNQQFKCISWTIEWIDDQGRQKLASAFETLTVQEAYLRATGDQHRRSKRRRLNAQGPSQSQQSSKPSEPSKDESALPRPAEPSNCYEVAASSTGAAEDEKGSAGASPSIHFYLLRPQTPTSKRVLITVSPSTTIAECLKGRVLLEFPTFYALPDPPDALPTGFVLESEYMGQPKERRSHDMEPVAHPTDVADKISSLLPLAGADVKQDTSGMLTAIAPSADVQHILEVLKGDIVASAGP